VSGRINKSNKETRSAKIHKTVTAAYNKPAGDIYESGHDSRSDGSEVEQIIDASIDAIRIINKDFTIRRINFTFAEMTGVDRDEVTGKKCWEVFPSLLCHTPECRLQRILNGEESIHVEIERRRKDSTIIPCVVIASPLTDNTGNLTGIIEQFRDITERRHMEEHIKESEERYRALIELGSEAGEAIVMLQDIDDNEGIQTFVNDQWSKITGYSRDELLGVCFFDLLQEKYRQPSRERHRQKLQGISVSGIFEMVINRKDGQEVPIELTGAFTTYQGQRANVMYIRDISARKKDELRIRQSEEHYSSLFEEVPVAIWEHDYSDAKKYVDTLRDSGVTDFRKYFDENPAQIRYCMELGGARSSFVNKAAVCLMDAKSREQLQHEIIAHIIKRPDGLLYDKENILSMIEGKTENSYDFCDITFKNKLKYLHVIWHLAPGHERDWSRVYHIFYDITERKLAEEKVKKYQGHLEDLVKERTAELESSRKQIEEQMARRIEFTRALVHELKTPLTPLLGASEMLANGITDPTFRHLALNINRGAKNLNNRVMDLLDITKGEMGVLELNNEDTDLNDMLTEIYEYVKNTAYKKGQELVLDLPEYSLTANIDGDRLRQVVLNLLDNAMRYTPEAGIITIRLSVLDGNPLIQVQDTGCGIEEKSIYSIYELYKRVEKHEQLSGLGLGLPLSKMLVELHGGKIWLSSKKDSGTTVSFTIPAKCLRESAKR
jgi:PAS domain S-box-containing protein